VNVNSESVANGATLSIRTGTESPVFILGLHRSGTTWLYELLARSGCFDALTAGQVICYDEYLADPANRAACGIRLRERFEQLGLTCRGTEAVRLSPDTPEEYGFVLDNHGAGLRLSRRGLRLFQQMAHAVRADSGGDRRLLLKNPWDFSNACLIKQLLPGAQFIFIHRNPFHVLSSMFRLVMSTVRQPDPYTAMLHRRYRRFAQGRVRRRVAGRVIEHVPGLLVRGLLAWVQRSTEGYLRSWPMIPPSDRIDVTYERLCQDPDAGVTKILHHLGVRAGECSHRRSAAPRDVQVAGPVVAKRDLIARKLNEYGSTVGYDLQALADEL
jgi:hypothetical protein